MVFSDLLDVDNIKYNIWIDGGEVDRQLNEGIVAAKFGSLCKATEISLLSNMSFGHKKKWQHFFRLMDQILPQNLPQRQIHPFVTLSDRNEQAWPLYDCNQHVWIKKVEKLYMSKLGEAN